MTVEPDYVTVQATVDPHKFCVAIMRYVQTQDEYVIHRISTALPKTSAYALAASWAAIDKLEIR